VLWGVKRQWVACCCGSSVCMMWGSCDQHAMNKAGSDSQGLLSPKSGGKIGRISPHFPLEVGPLESSYRVWGSAVNTPSGSGWSPAAKRILMHFELKSRHLVAPILMIFVRNNWSNVLHFEHLRLIICWIVNVVHHDILWIMNKQHWTGCCIVNYHIYN